MKIGKYNTFPALRREYKSITEIGDVINRGPNYIVDRLKGVKEFSAREKRLLLMHIHQNPDSPEIIKFYFGGAAHVES